MLRSQWFSLRPITHPRSLFHQSDLQLIAKEPMPQLVNPPTSPGAYWARYSITNRWHLIVHVTGEAPFQTMRILQLDTRLQPIPDACRIPHQLIFGIQIMPPDADQPAQ